MMPEQWLSECHAKGVGCCGQWGVKVKILNARPESRIHPDDQPVGKVEGQSCLTLTGSAGSPPSTMRG